MGNEVLIRLLMSVLARTVEADRRLAGTEFRGRVKEVDGEKKTVRLVIGTDPEGNEVLSPRSAVGQTAGAMKFHDLPSVGQQMTLQSASGDIQQARAVPLHWSEGNEAISDDPAVKIMQLGDVTVQWGDGFLEALVGGTGVRITSGGVDVVGPSLTHNDVNVGDDHKHQDVMSGPSVTGVPVGG